MEGAKPVETVRKKNPFSKVILWAIVLVIINILAYQVWLQVDLTRDKRFSINSKTEHLLKNLPEPVRVKIFLTGDKLPSGFKKLAISTEELVRNFREISRSKVDYEVIDLQKADTNLLKEISRYGISNFPVTVSEGKGKTTQIPVTPYALVEKGSQKIPVLLQSFKTAQLSENDFNNSLVLLEYNIANAIRKVSKPHLDSVLYLLGNQESGGYEVFQLANTLSAQYIFHADTLQRMPAIPAKYKAVIINQPKQAFSEEDKYKIDQYLMQGGNLLFCIKGTTASFDSLKTAQSFTAVPIETNLNHLLFSYGVRIGNTIVSDLEKCVDIPLQNADNQAGQSEFYLWPYFPIFSTNPDHPVTKNLNEVLGKFPSAIELVNDQPGIKKTVLLHTSNYAKIETTPLLIDITSVVLQPERFSFNKKQVPTGVLLEGKFNSIYANRIPEELAATALNPLKESERSSRIAVFSDGDIFNNEFAQQSGPKEIGTYMFSPYVFDNKNLMLNTMEYLTDTLNLLDVRSKTYQASILDKKRKEDEALKWQIINIGVPAGLVILFGIIFNFVRRRKYTGS
ncbi:MAG: gliding motility-associated ABC transporter substrate-binding protein GldG [Taibaiella sp.]|nr:gliding motility-associated ABC transporter substrate-binding protein GldG [Taibaiella sp.]